jgi:hypothetical protein
MSDFLTRLGARHTVEPAVRPRAASRFEQASALPLDRETLAVDANPAEHARRGALTDALVAPDARSAVRSRTASPTRTSPAVEPTATFADNVREREPTRSERARPPLVPFAADGLDVRVAPLVDSPRPVDDRQRATAAIVPRASSPVVRDVPAVMTRVADRAAPTSSPARAAILHDGAASQPDVVRVHIGRVEVRAVMPPAERARPRGSKTSEAQGPLSLDRYLSGKRRP